MSVDKLIGYIQARFGEDHIPPNGRWSRTPDWIPPQALSQISSQPGTPVDQSATQDIEQVIPLGTEQAFAVEAPDDIVPETDEESEQIQQETRVSGTDALAFYLPFHFYRRPWGIYLRLRGVAHLARILNAGKHVDANSPLLQLAAKLLYEHELFHHQCEMASSFVAFSLLADHSPYPAYFSDTQAAEREEAMANASSCRARIPGFGRVVNQRLTAWMASQGKGYRDFGKHLTPAQFNSGKEGLAKHILWHLDFESTAQLGLGILPVGLDELPGSLLFDAIPRAKSRQSVPVYVIQDADHVAVRRVRPFPTHGDVRIQVYSNEHPPIHFHLFMRDKPRGRFTWPELSPLKEKPPIKPLSNKEKKAVSGYLRRYGTGIREELQKVFRTHLPAHRG